VQPVVNPPLAQHVTIFETRVTSTEKRCHEKMNELRFQLNLCATLRYTILFYLFWLVDINVGA
jgi:hypothetical protein